MVAEKVVVQLVLDTSRYTSGASSAARSTAKIQTAADKTSRSVSSLGGTALKAGAALGAAFAAKAALDFAKSSIAAFTNLKESINAVNVVYEEGADAIAALGEGSAESFGLSTRALNEAAVAMSAFADKIDAADPPGAFENVLQRATDFASVMNIEVGEALRLFQSGLAGESEPLRKFGIDVSAATITQVALANGIGDSNGKLDEGEKVQARYLAIMEQTEKTAGDFANTSGELAGSQKILTAKWEEAQAEIGEALEPAMVELLVVATDLVPIIEKVAIVVGDLISELAPLFKLVTDLVTITEDYAVETDAATEGTESWLKAILRWEPFGESYRGSIDDISEAFLNLDPQNAIGGVDRLSEAFINLDPQNTIFGLERMKVSVGEMPPVLDSAQSATARYNIVINNARAFADSAAAAEERRAAGIRSVLSAQAEAASPALRLLRANQKLVATQERLSELRAATGEEKATVEELTDAELDLVGAQIDVDSSAANLAGRVNESAEAFIETAVQAGLLRDEAVLLAESLGLIPTTIDVDLTIRGTVSIGEIGQILREVPGIPTFIGPRRHGGPVAANEPVIVGEGGLPELFIPDSAGRIIPNKGFGDQSIIVNINDSTTTDLAADLSTGLIAAQITQQVELLRT